MVLSRSRSVTTLGFPPTGLLTRSNSVYDLTTHVRSSPRYKPQWPVNYSTHAYKDWNYDLAGDYYFWDKSWYRLFHTDRHPRDWTYPYTHYRATWRNYLHNTNFPYYPFLPPYFGARYSTNVYRPYIYQSY